MAPKTKAWTPKSAPAQGKIARSGLGFEELMLKVSRAAFNKMASSCGLPDPEARELCQSFKDLKGE